MAAGGSDLRDATEGIVTFNQRIGEALSGKGEEAAELFASLGKSAATFTGDSADKFYQLLDALRQVPDPAKRVQLLLKAVGEDTGKNLIPLLSMSADQVQRLGDAFEQSGEDLQKSREASRAYNTAVAGIGRVWREVVTAVAPAVREVAERVTNLIKPVAEFVRTNRDLIVTAAAVAAGMVAAGAALIGVAAAISAVLAVASAIGTIFSAGVGIAVGAFKLLAAAVSALLTPYGLVAAAVAGLGYLFVTQTAAGDRLWKAIKDGATEAFGRVSEVAREFGGIVKDAWGGAVAAVKGGDLALAGEIAFTALELLWAKTVAHLQEVWTGFTRPFVEAWHEATDGLGAFFRAAGEVVVETFTAIWAAAKDVFDAIRETVRDAVDAVKKAFEGVQETVGKVLEFLGILLAPIVAPFLALASLVEQAWDGLSTNLMETINNFASWAEKSFVRVSDAIGNAFKQGARAALDAAIQTARALDALDPLSALGLSRLAPLIAEAERLRGSIGPDVTAEETNAKIAAIEAQRKFLEDELRAARASGRADRDAARAADEAEAKKKADEIEAKLRELLNKARALEAQQTTIGAAGAIAQALAGARPGAQLAAQLAGSQGSFSAVAVSQRFNTERVVQKKLGDIVENTAETVRAVVDLAKGLVFK